MASVGSLRRGGNPVDSAKAGSFIKTRKLEAAHLAGRKTSDEDSDGLPDSWMRSTTLADCALRHSSPVRCENQHTQHPAEIEA